MNPEVKAKWLEALRSGRYTQGKGALCCRVNGVQQYCCLGVLCEVLQVPAISSVGSNFTSYSDADGLLPDIAVRLAELNEFDPVVAGKGLAALNDLGKTFTEIADLIEEYL